jgi:hypothetical protein
MRHSGNATGLYLEIARWTPGIHLEGMTRSDQRRHVLLRAVKLFKLKKHRFQGHLARQLPCLTYYVLCVLGPRRAQRIASPIPNPAISCSAAESS